MRRVVKYLVQFIAEHDSWKKKKDLENTKEVVAEFKRKISVKEKDFRRSELLKRYMTKMLYKP